MRSNRPYPILVRVSETRVGGRDRIFGANVRVNTIDDDHLKSSPSSEHPLDSFGQDGMQAGPWN